MTLNLSEMLATATKSAQGQVPTWKNLKRNKKKRAKALAAPKRKRRKRSAKAREKARMAKVMEASHRLDLDGNPIIPFNQKPVNSLCQKCKGECKQTAEVMVCYCPYYNPIKPRKNAKVEVA